MDIGYQVHNQHRQQRPVRKLLRRLLTDILPTLLLLILMALGMSLVARYAESCHFEPVFDQDETFLQFSD